MNRVTYDDGTVPLAFDPRSASVTLLDRRAHDYEGHIYNRTRILFRGRRVFYCSVCGEVFYDDGRLAALGIGLA